MATVRCTCGRAYTVPDTRLGHRLKCAACGETFVATAAAPPKTLKQPRPKPSAPLPKMRLGELAVARGWVSREAVDACLRHVEAMRKLPGQENLRLGSVLVSKRLLTPSQLNTLLREQQRSSLAAAVAAVDHSLARRPDAPPVTEAQRETIRRSVEAVKQQLSEKEAAAAAAEASVRRRLLSRIKAFHVGLAICALLVFLVVRALWPAPKPQRVLEAYLRSCDETAIAPDHELAITDLGLVTREFKVLRLLPLVELDYAPELAEFAKGTAQDWVDLLSDVVMSDLKYEVLTLLYPALPDDKPPRAIGSLRVWVQPILCHMVARQRSMAMYVEGNYRFVVLRVESPVWRCGWKVAGYEPVGREAR